MDKQQMVLKANIKGLLGVLLKKLVIVFIVLIACIAANKLKLYVETKYNITGSIFKTDVLGTVSIISVYIVLLILLIVLLIAAYRFFEVFYELGRKTNIDFNNERIEIRKYEFPYDREVIERRFNRIVGVEVSQKSVERMLDCGTLYIEYLVLSKNDSKLRGIEIPFIEKPFEIKSILLEE